MTAAWYGTDMKGMNFDDTGTILLMVISRPAAKGSSRNGLPAEGMLTKDQMMSSQVEWNGMRLKHMGCGTKHGVTSRRGAETARERLELTACHRMPKNDLVALIVVSNSIGIPCLKHIDCTVITYSSSEGQKS
jgi:hypothetical protein